MHKEGGRYCRESELKEKERGLLDAAERYYLEGEEIFMPGVEKSMVRKKKTNLRCELLIRKGPRKKKKECEGRGNWAH